MSSSTVAEPALWDAFDSDAYWREHYSRLRDDDGQILQLLADHFAGAGIPEGAHGVDVGPGANLYPALAMLPWCRRLTLLERGTGNRAWLRDQVSCFGGSWWPFWDRLVTAQPAVYKGIRSPQVTLHSRAEVVPGSVYELPARRWDLGTMMFVSESITPVRSQFVAATRWFVRALKPGAPFVTAHSTGSTGYTIAGTHFPAVPVQGDDVAAALEPVAYDVELHPIVSANPFRDGVGVLLATGRARG